MPFIREENCIISYMIFSKRYFLNGNPTSWQYPLLNYLEFHMWVFYFSFVHFFAPFMCFWFWWGIRVNGFAFVTYISHITFFAKSWNQVNSSNLSSFLINWPNRDCGNTSFGVSGLKLQNLVNFCLWKVWL